MSQIVTAASTGTSPCVGVCRLDDDGFCEGCLRTVDEIGAWAGLDEGTRRAIMADLELRRRPGEE
jgi:predicted Fe-S protein YdhL (DUF1289 family)